MPAFCSGVFGEQRPEKNPLGAITAESFLPEGISKKRKKKGKNLVHKTTKLECQNAGANATFIAISQ